METPTPLSAAALVVEHRRDGAVIVVDCGGGWGGGVVERLKDNRVDAVKFIGQPPARAHQLPDVILHQKRGATWWAFREALYPDQRDGSPICLPDDPALRADLAAPQWEVTSGGILIEDKDELRSVGDLPTRGAERKAGIGTARSASGATATTFGGSSGPTNRSLRRSTRDTHGSDGCAISAVTRS